MMIIFSAIGREIGLIRSDRPVVITDEQLARLSVAQLPLALDAEVSVLKWKRETIAVAGNDANDAPVLRQRDEEVAFPSFLAMILPEKVRQGGYAGIPAKVLKKTANKNSYGHYARHVTGDDRKTADPSQYQCSGTRLWAGLGAGKRLRGLPY